MPTKILRELYYQRNQAPCLKINMTLYNPWILYMLYKNCIRKVVQTSRKASLQCSLQWWTMEDNGEEPLESRARSSGEQWTENSLSKESQENQELPLLPGQKPHRACPTGFNHHLVQWLLAIYCSFLHKWEGFCWICFQFLSFCSTIVY